MGLSERQMRMVHPRLLPKEVQEATRAALGRENNKIHIEAQGENTSI